MQDQYLTPDFIDSRIARSRRASRAGRGADAQQRAPELEGAIDALCDHLGIVLMQDVRKCWIVVPASGKGAFVHGDD